MRKINKTLKIRRNLYFVESLYWVHNLYGDMSCKKYDSIAEYWILLWFYDFDCITIIYNKMGCLPVFFTTLSVSSDLGLNREIK